MRSSSTRSTFSRLKYSHHSEKTMNSPPTMSGSISGPTPPDAAAAYGALCPPEPSSPEDDSIAPWMASTVDRMTSPRTMIVSRA